MDGSTMLWLLATITIVSLNIRGTQSTDVCPNVDTAMLGIDPINTNLVAQPDAGRRGRIFEADDSNHVPNEFVQVVAENQCFPRFSIQVIQTYDEYRCFASSSYSFVTEEDSTTSLGSTEFNFQDNSGFGGSGDPRVIFIRDFLNQTGGEAIFASVECITHTINIVPFQQPIFTPAFLTALKNLDRSTRYTDSEIRQEFFGKFFRSYGTHFARKTHMGSKAIFAALFPNRAAGSAEEETRRQCVMESASQALTSPARGNEVSVSVYFDRVVAEKCGNEWPQTQVTLLGPIPEGKLENWVLTAKESPRPVRWNMEKISSLFKENHRYTAPWFPLMSFDSTALAHYSAYYMGEFSQQQLGRAQLSMSDRCGFKSIIPPTSTEAGDKEYSSNDATSSPGTSLSTAVSPTAPPSTTVTTTSTPAPTTIPTTTRLLYLPPAPTITRPTTTTTTSTRTPAPTITPTTTRSLYWPPASTTIPTTTRSLYWPPAPTITRPTTTTTTSTRTPAPTITPTTTVPPSTKLASTTLAQTVTTTTTTTTPSSTTIPTTTRSFYWPTITRLTTTTTTSTRTPAPTITPTTTVPPSTTLAPTTLASMTLASTTLAPTTLVSTTLASTTLAPTTLAPTTLAATTPTTTPMTTVPPSTTPAPTITTPTTTTTTTTTTAPIPSPPTTEGPCSKCPGPQTCPTEPLPPPPCSSACDGGLDAVVGRPQTLTSHPGFGSSNYPSYITFSRLLVAAPGRKVHVQIQNFNTEKVHDFLVLYDSWDPLHPQLDKLSGRQSPRHYTSSSSWMLLFFVSDASGDGPGFSLTYEAV